MCQPRDIQDLAAWFRARARETGQLHYTLMMLRTADELAGEAISLCGCAGDPAAAATCELKDSPLCPLHMQSRRA